VSAGFSEKDEYGNETDGKNNEGAKRFFFWGASNQEYGEKYVVPFLDS